GFPRERFFTPAARWLRNSAAANGCLLSCPIPASDISARSCGHKNIAPMDGLRDSKDGDVKMRVPALCVPFTPPTLDEVFSADLPGADCVEIRLDYLPAPGESVHARWDRLPIPVIATCRGKERGGRFEGSIQEEIRILQYAVENGAKFVDMDYRFARAMPG